MWAALHQDYNGPSIFERVVERLAGLSSLLPVVVCGHSLGGGYAALCGLELLSRSAPVVAVHGFGAPQVILRPKGDPEQHPLWQRLS